MGSRLRIEFDVPWSNLYGLQKSPNLNKSIQRKELPVIDANMKQLLFLCKSLKS